MHYHNLRTRPKKFEIGDKCLIFQPDTTSSRVFSQWRGPANIVDVKSPNSYIVELNGKRMHIHARGFTCPRVQLSAGSLVRKHVKYVG
jgi:hypothetical protein